MPAEPAAATNTTLTGASRVSPVTASPVTASPITSSPIEGGTSDLPLSGLRVLDLTLNIAGPFATMILGDLGAEVTKVERPPLGDDARRMVPTIGDASAYFLAINRNKRSVMLDLRDSSSLERFRALLSASDVFVTNLRPDSLVEFGLTYDQVHARAPRVIYADISAYGNSGPEADRAGYDMVLQARSGLMSVNGEADRPPARVGVSILDIGAGTWLALGVLAALQERLRTGLGTRVSTSLLETGANFMGYDIAAYGLTGEVPGRRGTEHPAFGPYGVFCCRGATYLAIGAGSDQLYARLVAALGRPEWASDPRFRDNTGRIAHRAELREVLEERLAERTAGEWVTTLRGAAVPADEVADVQKVLRDEQLDALGFWLDTPVVSSTNGGSETVRLPGLPVRVGPGRMPLRLAPPALSGDEQARYMSSPPGGPPRTT
jgi:crotonobetainyl-CoA:carnitine CoA-transferase CaiB-like acyl-CoA transferase